MTDRTFHQESVKRYGSKVSYSGGRNLSEREFHKPKGEDKPEPKVYKSRERLVIATPSTGQRLSRVESLLQREAARKAMKPAKHKKKSDKSLHSFGQGKTGGKQKTKGTSKPPMGHAPTSQAHIDVFYAGANKKWDVPPPPIDPLKTCNIKKDVR